MRFIFAQNSEDRIEIRRAAKERQCRISSHKKTVNSPPAVAEVEEHVSEHGDQGLGHVGLVPNSVGLPGDIDVVSNATDGKHIFLDPNIDISISSITSGQRLIVRVEQSPPL